MLAAPSAYLATIMPASSPGFFINRDFAFYWCVRIFTMAAFQMLAVAVGWQIYDLSRSAMDLGMVGLAGFLPALLFVLVAGHVADRYNRRSIVQLCNVAQCLIAVALGLASWQGWISREGIFVAAFLLGITKTFGSPTLAAMLPAIVRTDDLPRAVSASSAAMQAAIISGPALGGLAYIGGAEAVYSITALMYALSALLLGMVAYVHTPPAPVNKEDNSVFAGIAFIRRNPVLLGAISLDLFAVLLGGATALLPIFARDILQTGPWGLGLLRAAPAAGALLMSVWLARFPLNRQVGHIMFAAVAVFGFATIVFALSTSLLLSMAALSVLGASDMISVVVRSSLVQLETPDAMRGRVNAVNFLFIGASNQLGEFESGATAALFGLIPAVIIGGAGTLLVVVLWMRWFPALAGRDKLVA